MDVIVELYRHETEPSKIKEYENTLWDYTELSKYHQQQPGCEPFIPRYCEAMGGPGEPKYFVNGTVFHGP
jgi:hypothetical protein